jgi:hypothetical protein
MEEKNMEITRTGKSKYGYFVQYLDGSGDSFKGCTEQVSKYLSNKIPCTIEIQETDGEGKNEKITKVKLLSSNPVTNNHKTEKDNFRENVDAGNIVQRVTEIIVAKINSGKEVEVDAVFPKLRELLTKEFLSAKNQLSGIVKPEQGDFLSTKINRLLGSGEEVFL